eukprot:TRINITY_DN24473_c0_g2_i2.p1 TRINITY_DN24473_c0_g2~~TRINITY_DN24473_c0_g2_i2.p1  ORF type:complete len:256 (+),score=74.29 TRINITY_DN24473_c0_g2_i2:57-770(+)
MNDNNFCTLGFSASASTELLFWDLRWLKSPFFSASIEKNNSNFGILKVDPVSNLICASARKSASLKFFSIGAGVSEITGFPEHKVDLEHLAFSFNWKQSSETFPDLMRVRLDGSLEIMQVHWKKSYETLLSYYKASDLERSDLKTEDDVKAEGVPGQVDDKEQKEDDLNISIGSIPPPPPLDNFSRLSIDETNYLDIPPPPSPPKSIADFAKLLTSRPAPLLNGVQKVSANSTKTGA